TCALPISIYNYSFSPRLASICPLIVSTACSNASSGLDLPVASVSSAASAGSHTEFIYEIPGINSEYLDCSATASAVSLSVTIGSSAKDATAGTSFVISYLVLEFCSFVKYLTNFSASSG